MIFIIIHIIATKNIIICIVTILVFLLKFIRVYFFVINIINKIIDEFERKCYIIY